MGEYSTRQQKSHSLLDRQDYLLRDLSVHRKLVNVLETRIDGLYTHLDGILDEENPPPDCPTVLSPQVLDAYRNLSQAHTMYKVCNDQLKQISKALHTINDRLAAKAVKTKRKKPVPQITSKPKVTSKRRKQESATELPTVPTEEATRIREEIDDMLEDLYHDNN